MKTVRSFVFPAFAVFVSGAAIMSLEMLGSRLITPLVGATVNVWTALVTVFLASVAGGYHIGDTIADKKLSSRILAGFFFGSAFFVSQISVINTIARELFSETTLPYWLLSLLYTALLLAVPAILLGSITMYTIRFSIEKEDDVGRKNGILYAISTIGSLAGIIGTSFYLVPYFGISTILLFFAAILSFVGVITLLVYL